jgi:hypothetical protein
MEWDGWSLAVYGVSVGILCFAQKSVWRFILPRTTEGSSVCL